MFDPATRQLSREQVVKLTGGEINLLEALVRNAGKPLSRERLLALARDDDGGERNDRAIDIAILRLRRVIETDPAAALDTDGLGHRLPLFPIAMKLTPGSAARFPRGRSCGSAEPDPRCPGRREGIVCWAA